MGCDTSFDLELKSYRQRAETALERYLPTPATRPGRLHEAIHHSLMAGGKRLRPTLLLASFDIAPSEHDPEPAAAALESLHTYSLIHDDLPCMDDSALRRGRPTCHIAFDEATALLAGDALLTEAFGILARDYAQSPALCAHLVGELADAANSRKLIGGQMEDLQGAGAKPDAEKLDFIHANKTAALLQASLRMGVHLSALPDTALETAGALGRSLGLAFQIIDDILDATSDDGALGKSAGLDEANGTLTWPRVHGLEASRAQAAAYSKEAKELAATLGSEFLVELVDHLEQRIH